jgi:hypothetical protein
MIDRVHDRADAGHRVVQLEVTVAVPGEGRDAVAGRYAEAPECACEPSRAVVRVAVGIAVKGTFDAARDDLRVAVKAVRVTDQRRNHQRHLHHRAIHRLAPRRRRRPVSPRLSCRPGAFSIGVNGPGSLRILAHKRPRFKEARQNR